MVTIRIIVEGGIPAGNNDLITANNTESLRQSLNCFFSRLLDSDDISIIVVMGYGYRAAIKKFLQDDSDTVLFVDLDAPKAEINKWFLKCETEKAENPLIFSDEQKKKVFFMIQEMEAWFLKQPECFEKWAAIESFDRRDHNAISEHSLLKGKNVEDISKPSVVVDTLMKHFYEKRIDDKKRKLAKYGKLRTAPLLLDCLDVDLLEKQDTELQKFKNIFKKYLFSY